MAKVLIKSPCLRFAVSPISKLDVVLSPEVFIHGIPWQIEVSKDEENHSLAAYLNCAKEDDTSNWAVAACATVELLPFSDEKNPLKKYIPPTVFSPSNLPFGYSKFISWADLLNAENEYVKNDTIELKIEIMAEDPNFSKRSLLKFETIDKSCDCSSHATFRFTVTNVENLMALRSPQFILRGLPWDLTVYKDQTSTLDVVLLNESTEKVSCNVKMSVKLVSSKDDVDPIEKSEENEVGKLGISNIEIISWDELLKPENAFVNNNSITLEVKIEAGKPQGDVPNATKRRRLECSVCFEGMDDRDISTTKCGHMFCTACIKKAIHNREACPLCQKKVLLRDLRRTFLPAAK